jgi:tryptophan halogenase
MKGKLEKIVVLGGGTAGLLAGMTLKRAFPEFSVTIVHSPDIPVIGVGESTTALFPPFLHTSLGLERNEFFQAVRPSWKLGIRFLWGDPDVAHFNYPFDRCMSFQPAPLRKLTAYYCLADTADASRYSAMMDRALSPIVLSSDGHYVVDEGGGYHIENQAFIAYLTTKASQFGIELIEGRFGRSRRSESGDVECIELENGHRVTGDLFLDCSGFRSLLLGKTLEETFVSFADSLICDTAVVGTWRREQPVLPYTTAETMDHGWCWRIDFPQHVSRGYVFCSRFCTAEEATREFREKNPLLEDEVHVVPFRSGRYENFWVRNVAALGNASGFVEPLEASALHVLVEQIRLLCRVLADGDGRIVPAIRAAGNQRYRLLWDEVRDFLAIHYRFNRRSDSPFWRHCREHTDLAGATQLVSLYQEAGPSTLCGTLLPSGHIFGYDGFMTLLIGQRVDTAYRADLSENDQRVWNAYREQVRRNVSRAIPMEEGLRHVYGPAH